MVNVWYLPRQSTVSLVTHMSRIIFLTPLLIPFCVYAQCPYPVQLKTNKDFCLGSTLEVVSPSRPLGKIVWYRDGVAVDSNTVVRSYAATPALVAGSYAAGPGNNLIGSIYTFCLDAAGNIYTSEGEQPIVQKWAPGGGSPITVAGGHGFGSAADQLNFVTGIAVDAAGNLYVSDGINYRVQKWAPGAGTGTTVAGGNGPGSAVNQLNGPGGIYVDCDGNLYIADAFNYRIQKWAPGASSGVTVAGGTINSWGVAPNLIGLEQVYLDAKGNIYALDWANTRVLEWTPGASQAITVAQVNNIISGSTSPFHVASIAMYVDYSGNIYVPDVQHNQVVEWTPGATSGIPILNLPPLPAWMSNGTAPDYALDFDIKGNFYAVPGTGQQVLEWQLQSANIDSTYTPTTAGKYTAVCIDMNGYPVTTDTVIVNIPPAGPSSVQISATGTSVSVCTPITFTATPANAGVAPTFQWQVSGVNAGTNSTVYSNNLFANGDQVWCIMTADVGCTGLPEVDTSNVIKLSVDPHGTASVTIAASATSVCKGDSVSFLATVTNGAATPTFQWLVNGANISDNSASYSSDTLTTGDVIYCVITSDNVCGLAKSNSIPVTVNDPPVVEAGQVFTIPHGQTLTLDPVITGPVASYLWTPSAGLSDPTIRDPVAQPAVNTLYTLHVVSPGGCSDSGTILVNVYTPLSIPNAFTPNGDGRNDIFYVLGGPVNSQILNFMIFDRWGQSVFRVHDVAPGDPAYGWNGYVHGSPAPIGTYVYVVEMQYGDGSRKVYKGTVVLLR